MTQFADIEVSKKWSFWLNILLEDFLRQETQDGLNLPALFLEGCKYRHS